MINYQKENAYDYENGFILTSEMFRLGNILSHYELYKRIINVPGEIVELGVFKGSSFIQWGTFRELLENKNSRKIIGFDVFGNFPEGALQGDAQFIEEWNEETGNSFLTKEDLEVVLSEKSITNYELVKGNILETIPQYLKSNPHLRISMLHVDCDVYEPSKIGLEMLFDRVVRGGIIAFDDYGIIEGETLAVDEFFSDKTEYKMERFTFSHMKPTFIEKNKEDYGYEVLYKMYYA